MEIEIFAIAFVACIYTALLGVITANIMYPMGKK